MTFEESLKELSSIIRMDCLGKTVTGQQQLILKEEGKASQSRLDKVFIVNIQDPLVAIFPEKAEGDLLPFLQEG